MSISPSYGPHPSLESPTNRAAQANNENFTYSQFMLLGDSITQFGTLTLQAHLTTEYSRRLDVVNRGFSGFTSPMGLRALQKLLPVNNDTASRPRISIATIFFGANDACVPGQSQHVDLQDYVETLRRLLKFPAFQDRTEHTTLIVITPPPVNEHQMGPMPEGGYQRRAGITSQYAQAAAQVTEACGAHVLDFWLILMTKVGWSRSMGRNCCCEPIPRNAEDAGNSRESNTQHIPGCSHFPRHARGAPRRLDDFLTDGLHLTTAGYDVLFVELMKLIRQEIPTYAPENLPFVLPDWKVALGLPEYSL